MVSPDSDCNRDSALICDSYRLSIFHLAVLWLDWADGLGFNYDPNYIDSGVGKRIFDTIDFREAEAISGNILVITALLNFSFQAKRQTVVVFYLREPFVG